MIKKILNLAVISTALFLLFSACTPSTGTSGEETKTDEDTTVNVVDITLDANNKTIGVNETFTLKATISPENATNKIVSWVSSDTNIATVDDKGTVTGIAEGSTTITVTTADGAKKASCYVTVSDVGKTTYTVYHSFESLSGEFEKLDAYTEKLTGKIGEKTAAAAKTGNAVAGFTAKEITQVTIGNNTEVTVYYTRNTITLTFDTDGGSTVASISGKYGATVTAPKNPTKENAEFEKWSPALPATFPSANQKYTAKWLTTFYTVKHLQQPVTGSGIKNTYKLVEADTEKIYAKSGSKTNATAKKYEGFTAETFYQKTVYSTNDVIVSIYYNRNRHKITFDTDGGSSISDKTFLYGAEIGTIGTPIKTGYIFDGWTPELPKTMGDKDLSVKAKWIKNTDGAGTITATIY